MAGLRNTLQIRATQTQSQILTPQMQQAIRLLQLSTIELQQQIRQTVDSNPMLELDDSDMSSMEESYEDMLDSENQNDSDYDPFSDDSSVNNASIDDEKSLLDILGDGSINLDIKKNHEDEVYDSEHEHDSDNYSEQNLAEDNQYSDKDSSLQSNSQTEENQYSAEVKGSKGLAIENDDIYEGETTETLHDHLIFQLEMSPLDGIDKKIAEAIIDGIDDSGYLKESLEDILDCIKTQDPTVTIEDVNAVLKLVQHYDPLGVGARSVQECILIQLKALPDDTEYKKLAINLITNYIDLLSNRNYVALCQRLSIKEDVLKKVNDLITSLEPRPGNNIVHSKKQNDFVIPDLIVVKDKNGDYSAELNPAANLKVRINEDYAKLANKARNEAEKIFFKDHLKEAKWFKQSIDNRNDTLLKVGRCIVSHQKDFMEKGESAMHPMVLNDVAVEISMHESTISRITTEKYIHTPKGTFELKYFFSSSVNTESGGSASSTAIKAVIKEIISKEPPRKPLSDSKISDILNEKGLNVARRTVTKYRESLGIPSTSQRKQLI